MRTETEFEELQVFLSDYAAAEHDTEVALYLERNQGDYLKRFRRLEQFFNEMSTGLSASLIDVNDEQRAKFAAKAAKLVPRRAFKIKKWNHPSEGVLYQVYLTSTSSTNVKGYGESLLVRKGADGFKIVARYGVCRACLATGVLDGKRCPHCYAPGWDYIEGLKLKAFGEPQEIVRLEAPTDLKFLPEYESD